MDGCEDGSGCEGNGCEGISAKGYVGGRSGERQSRDANVLG